MGILDFFSKSKGLSEGAFRKHADRVANKRAQSADRYESILALKDEKSAPGVEALLKRFTYYIDPSITDQDEKDVVFNGIVEAGPIALEPIRKFLRENDALSWAVKVLDRMLPEDQVISELLDVASTIDIEYTRDPDKKVQLLSTLEERHDVRIADATLRFLDDVSEPVRFAAIATITAQHEVPDAAVVRLIALALADDSVRIRQRVGDQFSKRKLVVPESSRADFAKAVVGYRVDGSGVVSKA